MKYKLVDIVINHILGIILIALNANASLSAVIQQQTLPNTVYKQFTVDEGLPSNEAYHIMQDSKGYIWIATANGVSRFDGYGFKNYGLENGLVEPTILEIYEDYNGKLWLISASGKLAYIEEENIKAFPFNNRVSEFAEKSRGPLKTSFYVDSTDNVYMSFKNFGRLVISPEGIINLFEENLKESDIVIEKKTAKVLLVSLNNVAPITSDFLFINKEKSYKISFPRARFYNHLFVLRENENAFLLAIQGSVYRIKDQAISNSIKVGNEIIWANIDSNKNLWVAPVEGGIQIFKDGNIDKDYSMNLFPNAMITSVSKDNENGYWFSSLTHGIFYCPNIYVETYNESSGLLADRVTAVFSNREGVYVGYNDEAISKIQNNTIQHISVGKELNSSLIIRFIGVDSTSSNVWIGSDKFIHKLNGNDITSFFETSYGSGSLPRQMITANDGGYWIASSWGIRKFDGKKTTFNSRHTHNFSKMVYTVFQDTAGIMWLGTIDGLWKFENYTFTQMDENPLFAYPINHITGSEDGSILFGTKGLGLLVINNNNLDRISLANGLSSNFIQKVIAHESGIWVATSNGVSWIKGNLHNNYSILNITTHDGLPTNNINDIYVRGNRVYIATSKGLTVLNLNQITTNDIKPRTIIGSFRVSGMEVNTDNQPIKLNYNQNYITIDYVGLAYRNMGKIDYRYRLLRVDTTWVHTKSTNSSYSGLSFGKYTFEVQAQNSDGLWGDSTKVNFIITPPFWQTYWFIFLSTILFTATIFMIYQTRIRSIKHRTSLINNLNVYKQKSLRQQMNPHFIFNTLNSIQLYILERDHISSHKYLTKFAKLMRLVLDNSQQSSIPLKNELEALRLYLDLESIRLSGKFEYSIDIENNELLNLKVPTLLIQPFVENSIWHGIMLKPEQDGWVKISIRSNHDSLVCTIEDNGVGRLAAQKIREKQDAERKSLGFKITSQRVELLNSLYKEKFNIKYTDLNEEQGRTTGTRVDITIPFALKDDLETQ